MPPTSSWPTWLDEAGILAKSRQKGGESLSEHTWQVLSRLADQFRLRPRLDWLLHAPHLWEQMYWAAFLHDFGKAADGFQGMLRSADGAAPLAPEATTLWKERRHRHEVLSLAFVEWLLPRGNPHRPWVLGAILAHHKDADVILTKYGGRYPLKDYYSTERETLIQQWEELAAQVSAPTRRHLWRWLAECALPWAEALGLPVHTAPLCTWEEAAQTDLAVATYHALRDFARWHETLREEDALRATLTRGLIFTADHAASAGVDTFPTMPLTVEVAERPLRSWRLYAHQRQARQAPPASAILVAPTGSGKTEAALLWAAHQMQQRPAARLFYTLPYQASMNAMAERLAERYFGVSLTDPRNQAVAIQHSRALLKLYQEIMAADGIAPRAATQKARRQLNLARLSFYPIQVFSPYQMLKAAYSLKGYEALLVDYADALFIFDEIHAYDPRRMALIVSMVHWLAQQLDARFLVMTATLPPTVRQALEEALPHPTEIVASPKLFAQFQRHEVHVQGGSLLENLDMVAQDVRAGKNVLVICNRVAHAQHAFRALQTRLGLGDDQIVLLHGRFNGKDRTRKEAQLLQAVGVRQKTKRRPFVVVATQVVEVSLDIDLDTLYSDPAPLEALLQRFGRVNRGRRERLLCPVHVFREPSALEDETPSYLPYDEEMVRESMRVLEDACQAQPIDEARVTQLLEAIYAHPPIWEAWWKAYRKSAREFQEAVLGAMQPFVSADRATRERFYQLFDGVQVLPADCQDDYMAAQEAHDYLQAQSYLVNISWKQYHTLKSYELLRTEEDDVPVTLVPYDPDFGLDLDGARREARGA